MFSYEEIQKYNETDMCIYKYIISNLEKIQYMTIRELSAKTHTSPASILRFCGKNQCEGYVELKEALKKEADSLNAHLPSTDLQELSAFFERANSSAFEEKLALAVEILRPSDLIIFVGMGSSGTLAKYGARYFSNMGRFAVSMEDPYYPIDAYTYKNAAAILLSESGETKEVVEAANQFQSRGCHVLSITNSPLSTLAKLSDWNLSYHFEHLRVNGDYNATSQVPVLFVMETLAKRM